MKIDSNIEWAFQSAQTKLSTLILKFKKKIIKIKWKKEKFEDIQSAWDSWKNLKFQLLTRTKKPRINSIWNVFIKLSNS